jgi:histidinol phosphatase-like PHP family hydrolase
MRTGRSATVEQAVAASPKAADITRRRALLNGFLSRAQVLTVLNDATIGGPTLKDYRGDLQMHSQWSDGSETLAQLAQGCLARGYDYCAVTDHSKGLQIAGGMTMADVARQHKEIDATNRALKGTFRILKGVEANIQPDGELDVTAEERRAFEIVLAAPHADLRDAADQTTRMLTAVRLPGVHILAHPRGRKIGERAGVVADWDRVFAEAAKRSVAVEIDGDPSRQDIDFTMVPRAVRAGCLIALDSDAHSTDELSYAETSIAHARLADIPKARIINCWPVEKLLAWAKK